MELSCKAYASKCNRAQLDELGMKDGIHAQSRSMSPVTPGEQRSDNAIKAKCWVIEQSFGTLKCRFRLSRGMCSKRAIRSVMAETSWPYSV